MEPVLESLPYGVSDMTRLLTSVFLAAIFALPCSAAESESVDLRYKSYRNWSMHLPSEKWFPVKDGIKIPHAGGDAFAVELTGNDLKIDADGDGKLERTIKPLVDPKTNVSTTRVVLSGKSKAGESFRYAARLRKDGNGWEWAPGGAMAGTIKTEAGPVPIRIIDQNGNGRFDDIGRDAMIVGGNDNATLLSKTIFVDNVLRNVDLADDGKSLTLTNYDGPTAEIDMTTSFNSKAVLISSVIVSADKKHSFDVGAIEGPIRVPAAKYSIVGGTLGLGEHRVHISSGRMEPFQLASGTKREIDWGGPVASEFRFNRAGDKVQFSPDQIWYYGKAGEQYVGWNPIGKSPEFKILDKETGAVLEVAILPGSC